MTALLRASRYCQGSRGLSLEKTISTIPRPRPPTAPGSLALHRPGRKNPDRHQQQRPAGQPIPPQPLVEEEPGQHRRHHRLQQGDDRRHRRRHIAQSTLIKEIGDERRHRRQIDQQRPGGGIGMRMQAPRKNDGRQRDRAHRKADRQHHQRMHPPSHAAAAHRVNRDPQRAPQGIEHPKRAVAAFHFGWTPNQQPSAYQCAHQRHQLRLAQLFVQHQPPTESPR